MATVGDRLETYATMLDEDTGAPLTGLTIGYLNHRDPLGNPLVLSRLSWEELGDGNYAVYYQTTTSDLAGEYFVRFQFDDEFASEWVSGDEWYVSTIRTNYPTPVPTERPAGSIIYAPHMRDADDTHDSQYWRRDEAPTPGPHTHTALGDVVTFGNTSSISMSQDGTELTADANFGTGPGTVAEGSALAAKADAADLAAVALSGEYAELLNIPATFAPAPHGHPASEITSGVLDIGRIPTGPSGVTVALGNHQHSPGGAIEVPFGLVGGGALAAGEFIDLYIRDTITITDWVIFGVGNGLIQFDLRVRPYASFPAGSGHSICGASTKPKIETTPSNKAKSSTLTGWTTVIAGDSHLRVYIDSATTFEQVTLAIGHTRTI